MAFCEIELDTIEIAYHGYLWRADCPMCTRVAYHTDQPTCADSLAEHLYSAHSDELREEACDVD